MGLAPSTNDVSGFINYHGSMNRALPFVDWIWWIFLMALGFATAAGATWPTTIWWMIFLAVGVVLSAIFIALTSINSRSRVNKIKTADNDGRREVRALRLAMDLLHFWLSLIVQVMLLLFASIARFSGVPDMTILMVMPGYIFAGGMLVFSVLFLGFIAHVLFLLSQNALSAPPVSRGNGGARSNGGTQALLSTHASRRMAATGSGVTVASPPAVFGNQQSNV